MYLPDLIKRAHNNAIAHGFYDGVELNKQEVQERLMLIISEVAELLEADRNNRHCRTEDLRSNIFEGAYYTVWYKTLIKGSVEEELADICIRIFDLVGFLGYEDLDTGSYKPDVDFSRVSVLCFEMCFRLTGFVTMPALTHVLWMVTEYAKRNNIDLGAYIELKMKYNELREYKHGKAY